MNKNRNTSNFSINKPSYYKLTDKQTKQLLNYLVYKINNEELNDAIGYTYNCPYCDSKEIYKIEHKSHLYKFKCESCKKEFTNLTKSVISDLLYEESINKGKRFSHKELLKDTEVWLHFGLDNYRNFEYIPRKYEIGYFSDWRYNLIKIPHIIKNDHLINIYEINEERFHKLLDIKISNINKKEIIKNNKKRFIILTFKEGEFTPKQSLHDLSKQLMKRTNNSFEKYQDELKNEELKKYYQNLKNTLIDSYNVECETLTEPNRKDEIYKNIEIPYKHTYSLAYEMAIRNLEVKKILYALNYLKSIEKNVHKNFKNNKTFTEKIEDYRETLYSEYQHYINVEFHEKYLSLQFDVIDKLINDFEDELNKKYLIVPKENIIKTPESNRILVQRAINNSFHPNKNIDEEIEYKFDEKIYDDYTISIGAFVGSDQFDVSVIRPTFNSHIIDTNSFYIPINFTLPTEEIGLN